MSAGTPTTGLALFVKTPGLSPIKTRLAAGIGERHALALYRRCLRSVEDSVQRACRRYPQLRPYYAVAESSALDHSRWSGWPRLSQGEGDLGERLASVHRQLARRHPQTLLLGADLPGLQPRHLGAALSALARQPMAIGPGLDGGYYLFASGVDLPDSVFTQVRYSHSDTLRQFRALLAEHGEVADLEPLGDLDSQSDITGLIAQMPQRASRPQRRLYRHLRRYLPRTEGADGRTA